MTFSRCKLIRRLKNPLKNEITAIRKLIEKGCPTLPRVKFDRSLLIINKSQLSETEL
jgi:hypothetical protein